MSTLRKLSAFRQLSLNCESPISEQRRKSFKKQLSVDLPDEFNKSKEIKISIGSANNKTRDRPPIRSIKIAWEEEPPKSEGVIVTKCKEIRRQPLPARLTRHSSLEKDSILYSKQELTERLRDAFRQKEENSKTNLKIFLAHNTRENEDNNNNHNDDFYEEAPAENVPRLIQPLMVANTDRNNVFQIRSGRYRQDNSTPTPPNKPSAVVVLPVVEKDDSGGDFESKIDPKPIENVVIRPSTAAARREKFQKRTNSAFNSSIKDEKSNINRRPPLIRSLSAPTAKVVDQNKGKFLATKRKIKSGKSRLNNNKEILSPIMIPSDEDNSNKENPIKSKREMNRFVPTVGVDIVTMVSLISPSASDTEEVEEKTNKAITKQKSHGSPVKTPAIIKNHKEEPKNISLRKTVKSVSFQQSSIHAVRSFSTSFPSRRSSMATALMLGTAANLLKTAQKLEKRATNPSSSEDEERGAKRRLVRNEHDPLSKSFEETENNSKQLPKGIKENPKISIEIKTKTPRNDDPEEIEIAQEMKTEGDTRKDCITEDQQFNSAKEKQCWEMYCKMTDKGITVSYDTILRGMLTPTEYRMRKRDSVDGESSQPNPINE